MFTDPIQNLKQFGLREDMVVADLGAGTGFYSIAAAHMVPKGKVYAVEVQKDFVTTIRNKAKESHVNNLEVLWGNIEKLGGTKIGDRIVDAVIASNVIFQIEDRDTFIKEVKRILKHQGMLLVVDWSDTSSAIGPGGANVIPKNKMREMFEQNGFVFIRDIDALHHHYGIIFKKE